MNRWGTLNPDDIEQMRAVQKQIDAWQKAQFPNAKLSGAGNHLHREMAEAAEELADCFFLSSQCQRLGGMPMGVPEFCWMAIRGLGYSPASVILGKLAKNKRRNWPENPDAQGVYEANDDDKEQAENEG